MEKPIVEEKLIIELIVESSPEFDDDLGREEKGKDSPAVKKKLRPILDKGANSI